MQMIPIVFQAYLLTPQRAVVALTAVDFLMAVVVEDLEYFQSYFERPSIGIVNPSFLRIGDVLREFSQEYKME